MIMTEKEAYIYEWIREVSKERPELGGLPICPYALKSKSLIIDTTIDDIVPQEGYDVIIFIVEDSLNINDILKWVEIYNKKYSDYLFLEDCASKNTFINGVKTNNQKFNLILCQSTTKLKKFREQLAKTEYYSYWSEDYLKEILGDDRKLVKK